MSRGLTPLTSTIRLKTALASTAIFTSLLAACPLEARNRPEAESSAACPVQGQSHASAEQKSKCRNAFAVTTFVVKAPLNIVWEALTDFSRYPQIFRRITSCKVTKQDGNLIYLVSDLKPCMLIRKTRNQTVNDLSGKPHRLDWQLINGNCKSLKGRWELESAGADRCRIKYTLELDPGPLVPACLVSFGLRSFQKEAVSSLTTWVESSATAMRNQKVSSQPDNS